MYKLLFADDEVILRDGIQSIIEWKSLGIELVGVAEDGKEALEIALRECPDIVITDILMPFMDGLELTRRLRDTLPDTKIIILSGYDEFKYAQAAINYKVYSYLLKPIVPDKLIEIVQELIEEIDSKKNNGFNKYEIADFQANFGLPMEEINILKSTVKLGYPEKIDELVESIFNFAIERCKEDSNSMITAVQHIVSAIANMGGKIINESFNSNDEFQQKLKAFNIIYNCESTVEVKENLKQYLLEITRCINSSRLNNDKLIVQKCKETIKENFQDINLDVGSIAAKVHFSPGYISQLFKKETGISINQFLISVRLERTKELLRTTDKKLHEIASDVGYKDEFYLSNAFKKNIGMRPTEFRDLMYL